MNGYNNLIQIATDDMQLGFNASVNEFGSITSEVSEDFETPSKPADQQSDQMRPDPVNQLTPSKLAKRLNLADQQSDLTQQTSKVTEYDQMQANLETTGIETLTQDERKLSLILGVAAVAFLASFFW